MTNSSKNGIASNSTDDRARLKALAKPELHCHLELSYPVQTFRKLCALKGVPVPKDDAGLAREFFITQPMNDLAKVLHKFVDSQKLVASSEALRLLTCEVIHGYVEQGCTLLELRYAPTFIQGGDPSLSFDQIHAAISAGVADCRHLPIQVGLIVLVQRTLSVEVADRVVDFAIANRDSIVAVDLADNEIDFPCAIFEKPFRRAKNAGLKVTIHAGEAPGPDSSKSIMDAIEILGADRIGHGVQAARDAKLVDYLARRGIALELCPTSNWLTQVVPTVAAHPLRILLHAGVNVTLNSDDPGIFGTSLLREYELAFSEIGCTFLELEQIAANGFRASFLGQR